MSKKTLSIMLVAGFVALALILLLLRESPREQPIQAELPQVTRSSPPVPITKNLLHRYDPSRDPKASPDAARNYYARREKMIREFHGDGQIEKPLARLKSGRGTESELITALGAVRRHETTKALPYIANLLTHSNEGVRYAAVALLCWFGDKRGFDFVMSKMEGPDSEQWWGIFEKDFASQNPTEYLPRIKALLTSKAGSRVDVYVAAQVLAQLGDADSARYLLPVIEREPHMSVDTILKLTNVRDPSVTAFMQKLSKEGSTNDVKHAADVVLANQGDVTAQKRLLEVAKRVTGLPQPENADGTYKPGLRPKVIGEATPAWDGNAVFALEHGMEAVAPELAVPVLRDIAIHADNVRFSRTAIELLAKIGDEAARNALWEVARSVQAKQRTFEDTLFTTTGKALMLFGDPASASLATTMFSGDKHGMEVSQFLAESRGWGGLFKLDLFY
jgi:HEAT repeat protein